MLITLHIPLLPGNKIRLSQNDLMLKNVHKQLSVFLQIKLITQTFSYYENEILSVSWLSPKDYIGFEYLRCQYLSLHSDIQDLKVFEQSNKRPLFNDLSNRSTFLGSPGRNSFIA